MGTRLRRFALGTIATAIALALVTALLPFITYDGSIVGLFVLAVIFGLVNGLIGPFLRLLSLPITVVTFGLFAIVVNGALLLITAALADRAGVRFAIATYPPRLSLEAIVDACVAAIFLSVVSWVTHRLVPD
jgi:putative membrane protein